jgi:hypothetical protein
LLLSLLGKNLQDESGQIGACLLNVRLFLGRLGGNWREKLVNECIGDSSSIEKPEVPVELITAAVLLPVDRHKPTAAAQ